MKKFFKTLQIFYIEFFKNPTIFTDCGIYFTMFYFSLCSFHIYWNTFNYFPI